MVSEAFAQLTEGQRICLRLVDRHLSSKQIARELGISKDTVDQRLDRARKLLGATDRFEAARAFAEFESGYHRIVYDPPAIAPTEPPGADEAPYHSGERQKTTAAIRFQETQAEYIAGRPPSPRRLKLPYPRRQEERNDLGLLERLGWIAVIAVAIPVLLGSLLTGLWALSQIAQAITR